MKNCSLDGPFLGIFGSNFSDFENFRPKNDQSVFEGKSLQYSSLDNCLFDLKIGIQVLCRGSIKSVISFFSIFIFGHFTGHKKAEKGHCERNFKGYLIKLC